MYIKPDLKKSTKLLLFLYSFSLCSQLLLLTFEFITKVIKAGIG